MGSVDTPRIGRPRHTAWQRLRRLPLIDGAAILATAALVVLSVHDRAAGSEPSDTATPDVRILNGGDAWGGFGRTASTSAPAGEISGTVSHVRDGDTIELAGTAVRFATLDCPEAGTLAGDRATAALRSLLRHETVTCRRTGETSYDRRSGTCRVSGGRSISDTMIAAGLCRRWR
ncbi:hypothetical protein P1J78_18235 [Psychromarinibacter sp. C21-152]|uniref:TNase-like domain-containing protein n=1 Tax=Psychromarinibacter sediminicola TaxID=3033385 RepID=A0AAE3NV49_9RHOB|nr:hypothetical protein [Psychromarinibacter sediminicola]MDF0602682.1 hypothetical protein [Psychromarinibacter sediminicola]